jgi:hypothetical protein
MDVNIIREWRSNKHAFLMKDNKRTLTSLPRKVPVFDFKDDLMQIIKNVRSEGHIVTICVIVNIVLELLPDFKEGNTWDIRQFIYKFMMRSNFTFIRINH